MFENDKRSPLDKLKKGLYSRDGEGDDVNRRRGIHVVTKPVASEWEAPTETPIPLEPIKPKMGFHKKVLLASFAFFVVAAGIAGYAFFGGGNLISVDNIDIQIEGPVSVAGGEPLSFNVSVINKNGTDINLVDLIVKMPEGTKDSVDVTKDLTRLRESLGDIKSGGIAKKEISAVMFGEQDEKKEVKFTIEYRTKGSSAIFYKEKVYEVIVASSPVTVKVDALKQVNSGQQAEVKVTITSNSTSVVKDLLLALEYPFGFSFVSGSPAPISGNTVFKVGDLAPGAKKVFTIKGAIEGQDSEERVLRAHVGIESKTADREIATTIIAAEHNFLIEKPFLGVDIALDGTMAGDFASKPGKQIRADIIWTNNLPTRISEAVIEVKFSGNVLDKTSVSVDKGFYNSLTNSITWDGKRDSSLNLLAPGESGRVSFSFAPIRMAPGAYPGNPEIKISVGVKGRRVDDSNSLQELSSSLARRVVVDSELAIASQVLQSSGSISNTGPVPPRAEQKTTYTVVWTISNASNSISNAQVRATLPPYIEWTNVIFPDADIAYNPVGGEIVWNVGDVPQGAGVTTKAKQVAFQVAFTPSVTQVGSIPVLVSEGTLSGTDDFTGTVIRSNVSAVSTRTSDSGAPTGHETVQP
jgi:hypothetical protein